MTMTISEELYICKKLASIRGLDVHVAHERTSYAYTYTVGKSPGLRDKFNPLRDKALTLGLIEDYKISSIYDRELSVWVCFAKDISGDISYDEDHMIAVCKAVIQLIEGEYEYISKD